LINAPVHTRSKNTHGLPWKPVLLVVAIAILLQAGLASKGWWNPIVERHGWRQTQTALTAFWLSRGSPLLAYETPVFGPPWNFPLEFPLYQWAVSLLSRATRIPIDQSGRVISLICFWAGLLPVGWMVRRLRLPVAAFAAFALFYMASPLYLFWSRTVLIETMAMTFSLAYFATGVVCLYRPFRWVRCGWCAIFGTLAALVKITTFAGALLPLGLLYLFLLIRRRPRIGAIMYGLIPLVVPVAAGLAWAWFADLSRSRNPLQYMANDEMNRYNFGPLSLRATAAYWKILGFRMLGDVLGKMWGPVALISLFAGIRWYRGRLDVAMLAAIGFCTGPLMFANLYYIHDYYANGAAAYLYLALAILWGTAWSRKAADRKLSIAAALLFLVGSAYNYIRLYYPDLTATENSFVNTGRFLKGTVPTEDVLLIYGSDWDPSIPYYSQHRAIMDRMYRSLQSAQLVNSLANFAPGQRLGAVVACYEANEGWYRTRVLAAVAATGMSQGPAYQDDVCRAYLPPAVGRPAPSGDVSPDMTWLAMPSLGGSPRAPQLRNPLLEGLSVVPLAPDPARLAAIEGPDGAAAILANPGTRLALQLPGLAATIRLHFGIKAYAWRVRATPPVTFEVHAVRGDQNTEIWKKSLDPANQSRDRGEQRAEVAIPQGVGQVILETASTNNTLAHRAYWSGIEIR
jgi:hypothetical protein